MKKITLLLAVSALFFSPVLALAQHEGFMGDPDGYSGGYTGPHGSVTKVIDAVNMRNDTPVYLEGYIIKSMGGEKYRFKDVTGTVTVEIDDADWRGLLVGSADKIGIWGEVDKDWNSVKIDVDRVIKKRK